MLINDCYHMHLDSIGESSPRPLHTDPELMKYPGMLERRGYSDSLDDEIGPARLSLPSWDPGVVRRLDPGQSARQRIEFLG